ATDEQDGDTAIRRQALLSLAKAKMDRDNTILGLDAINEALSLSPAPAEKDEMELVKARLLSESGSPDEAKTLFETLVSAGSSDDVKCRALIGLSLELA